MLLLRFCQAATAQYEHIKPHLEFAAENTLNFSCFLYKINTQMNLELYFAKIETDITKCAG